MNSHEFANNNQIMTEKKETNLSKSWLQIKPYHKIYTNDVERCMKKKHDIFVSKFYGDSITHAFFVVRSKWIEFV